MDQRLQNYLHKSHFSRKNQSVVYLKKVTEVICKWPIGNRTICQNLIFLGRINLSMCETQKQKKNQTSAGRKFKIVQLAQYTSIYIYQDSKLLASLMYWYICFPLGWSGAEIKCTVHVALPKRPINQFNLVASRC